MNPKTDLRFTRFRDRKEREIQNWICNVAAKEMMWFLLLEEVCDDTMEHFLISDSNSGNGVLGFSWANMRVAATLFHEVHVTRVAATP